MQCTLELKERLSLKTRGLPLHQPERAALDEQGASDGAAESDEDATRCYERGDEQKEEGIGERANDHSTQHLPGGGGSIRMVREDGDDRGINRQGQEEPAQTRAEQGGGPGQEQYEGSCYENAPGKVPGRMGSLDDLILGVRQEPEGEQQHAYYDDEYQG